MAEYSRLAKGNFTSVGTSQYVNLPFQPDYVELWNYSVIKTAAANSVARAWWDVSLLDGSNNPTMVEIYNNSSAVVFDTILTGGITPFSAGLALQFGPVYQHTGSTDFQISKAAAALVTTTTAHGLTSGDVVTFSNLAQTSTTGMQQIAGIPFVITVTGTTTFTIPYNTSQSNFTAFNTATSTSNVGSFKQVLYPALYAPAVSFVTAITLGATTTVALSMPGNYSVGQQVAFRIPTSWGTTQLNSLPNVLIPGQPIYGIVTAVSASLTTPTITVAINSSGYTAFNSNPAFASYPGEKFPQVVPVGDANSGSLSTNFTSPSFWNGSSNATTSSINGPAIAGAFANNTSQGFYIGGGLTNTDSTAAIMANGNVIYWHAFKHDFASP